MTQLGASIKKLHSDWGGEYLDKDFISYLKSIGTEQKLTVHNTPSQNGIAERHNHTIVECIHAQWITSIPMGRGGSACSLVDELNIDKGSRWHDTIWSRIQKEAWPKKCTWVGRVCVDTDREWRQAWGLCSRRPMDWHWWTEQRSTNLLARQNNGISWKKRSLQQF